MLLAESKEGNARARLFSLSLGYSFWGSYTLSPRGGGRIAYPSVVYVTVWAETHYYLCVTAFLFSVCYAIRVLVRSFCLVLAVKQASPWKVTRGDGGMTRRSQNPAGIFFFPFFCVRTIGVVTVTLYTTQAWRRNSANTRSQSPPTRTWRMPQFTKEFSVYHYSTMTGTG